MTKIKDRLMESKPKILQSKNQIRVTSYMTYSTRYPGGEFPLFFSVVIRPMFSE